MGQKVLSLSKSSPQSSRVAGDAGERVREQTPGPWLASVDAYQGDPAVLPEVREDRPEVREQDWNCRSFHGEVQVPRCTPRCPTQFLR